MRHRYISLVWILIVLVLALVGCSGGSGSSGGSVITPSAPDIPGGGSGGPCPDPWVNVMITAPDTGTDTIPLGEYTFMAEISTTYPNRTDVVWTINGVEYTDADFAGGVSQVTVTFDAEIDEMEISVTATCTATDLRTDTDTDSRTVSVGASDEPIPGALITVRGVATGMGFFIAITPEYHLYGWGNNSAGQLGVGDTHYKVSPVRIFSDLPDKRWYSVAIHNSNVYAVDANGNLYAWGENYGLNPVNLGRPDGHDTMWYKVAASDLYVIATDMYYNTYLWSEELGVPYANRELFTKAEYPLGISMVNPQIAVSSLEGFTIFKDKNGNLLITDVHNEDNEDFVPLELGWGADDYAISYDEAAFIRDGILYHIPDLAQVMENNYAGIYDPLTYPYIEQIGTDTDWIMLYPAYDGIVAVKEDSPNDEIYFFGSIDSTHDASSETSPETVTVGDLYGHLVRTVQWNDRLLYLPDYTNF